MAQLAEYNRKRDFHRTSEPSGRVERGRGHSFVVQKHAARRLHYDFRLELDGVLKSWAVPKGPSLDPSIKRLAVEVEDHPLSYADFEGTIPHGEYGGGSVLVWDRGSWEPEGDPHAGLDKGHLRFALHGDKLSGTWNLVRTRRDPRGKPQWLLIKSHDEAARPAAEFDVEEELPQSVITGVRIDEVAAQTDESGRLVAPRRRTAPRAAAKGEPAKKKVAPRRVRAPAEAAKDALPEFIAPQLATLVAEPPVDDHFIIETKFDGYRALARIEHRAGDAADSVRIYTRSGKDWTARFAPIARALAGVAVDSAYLDGEIVVLDAKGQSNFQALQNSLSEGATARLVYYVFDLLYLNGHDLRGLPLAQRKELLAALCQNNPHEQLRFSAHQAGDPQQLLARCCKAGGEGILCKDDRRPYQSSRSADWLKVKCKNRQEFVIVGYTAPRKTRDHLGALLLGAYESHERGSPLCYVGRVGTGFDSEQLRELKAQLARLKVSAPPVYNPERARTVTWVEPRLVAEIEFGSWTADRILRHAVFRGLRADKSATEVVIERPAKLPAGRRPPAAPAPGARNATPPLTNPDKSMFPPSGPTKQELADYYARVERRMWPYVQGRTLSLLRCPEGHLKECFFQRHLTGDTPEPGLASVELAEKDKVRSYRYLESPVGLRSLVQLGGLEVHLWGSRAAQPENPVELVFDLDPAPGVGWPQVEEGALAVKELLTRLGLKSFVKLSGGKGVHIHAPLRPSYSWDQVRAFSHAIARQLASQSPERFTAVLAKSDRTGKIFIDYLRNGRGATFIAPFSVRARDGAPVAVPIAWSALGPALRPDAYSVRTIEQYFADYPRDPWAGFTRLRQRLALFE